MAERIVCIEDVGRRIKKDFLKNVTYRVFESIPPDDPDHWLFEAQNSSGRRVILFSTENPTTRQRSLLQDHFDLSRAPILRQAAGL